MTNTLETNMTVSIFADYLGFLAGTCLFDTLYTNKEYVVVVFERARNVLKHAKELGIELELDAAIKNNSKANAVFVNNDFDMDKFVFAFHNGKLKF